MRNWVSRFIALVLAAGALYLAFRDVDARELLDSLGAVRTDQLLLCLLVSFLSFILRGLRWRTLLSARGWLPPSMVFWANMAGYLGNSFLPARAGELIRAVAVDRAAGVGKAFALATALSERVLDAGFLVVVGGAALYLSLEMSGVPRVPVGVLIVLSVGVLLLAMLLQRRGPAGWSTRCVARLAAVRGGAVASQLLSGVAAIVDARRALAFGGYTVGIWLLDSLGTVLAAQAMGLTIGLHQAVLLLAALGLASALPSTPGALGITQLVAVSVLVPFGIPQADALGLILVSQALFYVLVSTVGAVGMYKISSASWAVRS